MKISFYTFFTLLTLGLSHDWLRNPQDHPIYPNMAPITKNTRIPMPKQYKKNLRVDRPFDFERNRHRQIIPISNFDKEESIVSENKEEDLV